MQDGEGSVAHADTRLQRGLGCGLVRHVRHVCLALRDVVRAVVVHGVRALPREVRHQQQLRGAPQGPVVSSWALWSVA